MIGPVVVEVTVTASPSHAFDTWTRRCSVWWPRSHSMSQAEDFQVIFEPYVGGRIYEIGPDGIRHQWGEVTGWNPPNRVEYRWHIFLEPDEATTVTVTFDAVEDGTLVRLVNSGFEVFGDGAPARRDRVGTAWARIVEHYLRTG
ncbi:MAG: SRPBCC domain-containing protein [Actinobacteria bacterium]|nr:SRPBCC domain-containing protein [Actinomycetota bacterium]MCI0679399.1 SRPBCC domain-containing protein [Actinomycetota bacterium]